MEQKREPRNKWMDNWVSTKTLRTHRTLEKTVSLLKCMENTGYVHVENEINKSKKQICGII